MGETNHTGCYGCQYNHNGQCTKYGASKGVMSYKKDVSTTTSPNHIPASTYISPDEIEITEIGTNGVKFRRKK